jgi:uncharacterized protein YbbK (DUF523 family)
VGQPVLVSGCLLGISCRYDGKSCKDETLLKRLSKRPVVSLCPEQLGGRPTPRPPARIVGGSGPDVLLGSAKVLDSNGLDVTEEFLRGAELTCKAAKLLGVKKAFLKTGSPSCGWRETGKTPDRCAVMGVTAALLARQSVKIIPRKGGR